MRWSRTSDPDWSEVAGTIGKTVSFIVKDKDGAVVDISGYDEDKIQLKVFENDGTTLKFEKDMTFTVDGSDGGVSALLNLVTDIGRGDERSYFFVIELGLEESNTATGVGTDTIFQTNLDEANDFWNGFTITFTAGVNNGEFKVITDYALATGLVTVASAFTGAPGAGDAFTITPAIIIPTTRGTLLITQGAPE